MKLGAVYVGERYAETVGLGLHLRRVVAGYLLVAEREVQRVKLFHLLLHDGVLFGRGHQVSRRVS